MADETPNTMNLDLNLGPGSVPPTEEDTINLDEWINDPVDRTREGVIRDNRPRWRWRHFENPLESESLLDLSHFLTSVSNQGGGLHMGEGSVAAEERVPEVETDAICENKIVEVEDEALGSNEEDGKGSNDEGSFYDCNICFELAKDPIITCCGHLYCWPCIYRWLHIHSDTNECPVCKGEVTTKNVTPVYGRGHNNRVPLEDLTIKIPPRPIAKRVESVQRNAFSIPMEEMIRRLGRRFDLTQDLSANQNVENDANTNNRSPSFLLNRLMTTRAMRREQTQAPENVVDLTENRAASPDTVTHNGIQARLIRRSATNRSANTNNPFPSSMSTSERVMEAYIRSHPIVRRPEQSSPVDDRDSFSSVAAVMHSGSQTMDTAVEIDSVVSLSTSSSRRRNDTSTRASDVDSGDSRPPRRRRLN